MVTAAFVVTLTSLVRDCTTYGDCLYYGEKCVCNKVTDDV